MFTKNRLSVLAVKNGVYRVATTDAFLNISDSQLSQTRNLHRNLENQFQLPDHINALSVQDLTSESKALDAAYLSGMLDAVFDDQVSPVLRGREYSINFDFDLADSVVGGRSITYEVDGVQLEVDGGYEGRNGLYLVEAKNRAVFENMNLRQLIYPYFHYRKKLNLKKPVYVYILFYDAVSIGFSFFPLKEISQQLLDPDGLLDYERTSYCELRSQDTPSCGSFLDLLLVRVDENLTDRETPFPQADDFERVYAIFRDLIDAGPSGIALADLFRDYSVVPRQWDYYFNVLRWMRLAARKGELVVVSAIGVKLWGETRDARATVFQMASIAVSNELVHAILHKQSISDVVRYRQRLDADSTFYRRIQSIQSWLRYFEQLFGDPELN